MNLKRQFVELANRQLYTAQYLPNQEICDIFIFCHPLFEEKKATQRFFVELARKLISKKIATVHFDMAGCGESSGVIADYTYATWLEDYQAITTWLQEQYPSARINLLTVRFGTLPALQTAQNIEFLNRIILIDPVNNGQIYLEEAFRQKLVREMVTFGESKTQSLDDLLANAQAGELLDLDGVAMSRELYNSIYQQDLTGLTFKASPQALLIQQSPKESLLPENNQMMDILLKQDIAVTAECLRCPPFWKAVDLAEINNINQIIYNWL